MSGVYQLDPAPMIERGNYGFLALTALRLETGLQVDVQVVNGSIQWSNPVLLSIETARTAAASAMLSRTKLELPVITDALLELYALTEHQMRKQAPPQEWQPPIPLHATAHLPPFPVDVLPKWMQDYVCEVAESTQTPADLAGMLALAALALTCQRLAVVQIREGYQEPLCLYVLVAMDSGERKSAVYNAIAEPVYAYERDVVDRWTPTIAAAASERKIMEQALTKAVTDAAKDSNGRANHEKAAQIATQLATTVIPARPVLIIQDSTPEAMIMELAEQYGVLAALDAEGGLLDTLMGARYSESPNLDPLLKAHSGDEIRAARISRSRVDIRRPMLTIGIAPQPEVLASMAEKPGAKKRGLLARFLYSLPRSRKGTRDTEPADMDTVAAAAYKHHITRLLLAGEPAKPGMPFAQATLLIQGEAYRAWIDFAKWLEPQLAKGASLGSTNGWAEKLAGVIARIAGMFHRAESTELVVSVDAMRRAIVFGRDYALPHALTALRCMGADPAAADAQKVLDWLTRTGRAQFSLKDLCSDLRKQFDHPEAARPSVDVLIELGYLEGVDMRTTGVGRKPSQRFEVNPYFLQDKGGEG